MKKIERCTTIALCCLAFAGSGGMAFAQSGGNDHLLPIDALHQIVLFVPWWAIGVAGFFWAWTFRFDFTTGDVLSAVVFGAAFGPFTWPLGWFLLVCEPRTKRLIRSFVRHASYRAGARLRAAWRGE
jgi:hypothetical protein